MSFNASGLSLFRSRLWFVAAGRGEVGPSPCSIAGRPTLWRGQATLGPLRPHATVPVALASRPPVSQLAPIEAPCPSRRTPPPPDSPCPLFGRLPAPARRPPARPPSRPGPPTSPRPRPHVPAAEPFPLRTARAHCSAASRRLPAGPRRAVLPVPAPLHRLRQAPCLRHLGATGHRTDRGPVRPRPDPPTPAGAA